MKNSKDIMHVKEIYNSKNELSLELHCSGKDALTKKFKVYVKRFKVPKELKSKKELEQFRLNCQLEYKKEVELKSKGILYVENVNISFCDYADSWLEKMLIYNKEALNHYSNCKGHMKVFREKFGLCTLQEMTLPVIQKFCDWLCQRTYQKEVVTVKESLRDLIKERKLTFVQIANDCNLSTTTLKVAMKENNKVNRRTADKICKYLNVSFNKYFDLKSENVFYSKSANRSIKVMLHTILAQAVREGLIATNYASSEYIKPVTGTSKKKEIYNSLEEIQRFIKCIDSEKDIRKKVAFSIAINLGLRSAEIAGLSWADIDFEKESVDINKNTMYIYGFGTVTKGTKNTTSTRFINVPIQLIKLLKEYKIWWDEEKRKHGDLWAKTDKLFVQNKGKDMSNSTIAHWLTDFQKVNDLKHVTLHGLRHTNITMQIINGMDIKTVSSRAGHKDIQTTLNIYSHYTNESDKKASDLIGQLLYSPQCV